MAIFSSAEIEIRARDNTKKGIESSQKSFKGLATSIAGATAAMYGLYRMADKMVKAYQVQEQAEMKLAAALRATHNAVGISKDKMLDYAKSLQQVSTFGDEAVIKAQALMVTFTQIGRDVFPRAIEAAMDMSTMFGQDLQQSVIQLGTALNDPIQGIGRLRRIGISFTEAQKDMIKQLVKAGDVMGAQKIILEELNREFGGVARAAGETATGALKQFNNKVGDLNEAIGKSIVNSINPWVKALGSVVDKITELINKTNELKDAERAVDAGKATTAQKILVIENKLKEIDTEMENNSTNWISGSDAYLENLKKERSLLLARLNSLRQAQKYEEAAQKYQTEKNRKLAEQAKKEAEISRRQAFANKIYMDIAKQFRIIDRLAKIYGDEVDTWQEKHDVVKKALEEIINKYGANGLAGAQEYIIKQYGEYIQKIAENTQQPAFQGPKTMADFALMAGHGTNTSLAGHGGGVASVPTVWDKLLAGVSPFVSFLSGVGSKLIGLITSLSSVKALLDPISTILQGAMKVLAPLINDILKPLQGALIVFGELIGHILAPILKALSPAIEFLAQAFVWIYNKVLVPVGNGILWVIDKVIKALDAITRPFRWVADLLSWVGKVIMAFGKNVGIAMWNITHPFQQKGYVSVGAFRSNAFNTPLQGLNYTPLQEIGMSALNQAGAEAQGTTTGTGANYTAGRNQTFNIYVSTDVVAGDDGLDALALMIRNRIQQLEAIGL